MRENTDQKKSEYGHSSCSVFLLRVDSLHSPTVAKIQICDHFYSFFLVLKKSISSFSISITSKTVMLKRPTEALLGWATTETLLGWATNRVVFRTLSNIWNRAFWKLRKKISILNIWQNFEYASTNTFKVNNRNTGTRCEICLKLTIKTPDRRQWVSIVNFEQVNAGWNQCDTVRGL